MKSQSWVLQERVVYAERETGPLHLDAYLVEGRADATVLYVHSGGWLFGDRTEHGERLRGLADQGLNVISVDYRTSNVASHPAQHDDLVDAIRWIERGGVGDLGGTATPGQLVLVGASVGAQLAALAMFDPQVKSGVAGFVGLFGRYDLTSAADSLRPDPTLPMPAEVADAVPPAGAEIGATLPGRISLHAGVPVDRLDDGVLRPLSPVYHVPSDSPPMLVVHGDADAAVHYGHSERFAAAAREAGVPVTLELVAGANHEGVEFDGAAFLARVARFVRDCVRSPAGTRSTNARSSA